MVTFGINSVSNKTSKSSNPTTLTIHTQTTTFTLSIADVTESENLPIEYRREGAGASPPISWKNAPPNTGSFIVFFYQSDGVNLSGAQETIDDDTISYGSEEHVWLLYNIPNSVHTLKKNINPNENAIRAMAGGNQYGYNPPYADFSQGTKNYRLVVLALTQPKISNLHVSENYQEYLEEYVFDSDRNRKSTEFAGLAYSLIDYIGRKN